ncbi:MAG: hypothetical protein R6V44_13510 [Paracoccaceae bacterium]
MSRDATPSARRGPTPMIEPVVVTAAPLGLIGAGASIFLALGAAGLLGLYMARGSLAFFFAGASFSGGLAGCEPIALPPFILMGNLLAATPLGANIFHAAAIWLRWLRGLNAQCLEQRRQSAIPCTAGSE